jgi:hypothetical protein
MKENEDWSDFQRFVFRKLNRIEDRLTKVEIRAAVMGAMAAVLLKILWK